MPAPANHAARPSAPCPRARPSSTRRRSASHSQAHPRCRDTANPAAVRFCRTSTGNSSSRFNGFDNLDLQPGTKSPYVAVQHSDDRNRPRFDDYPADDILKIAGYKVSK